MLSSSTICLLVPILGALLAQNSEAAGICGDLLQQVQVRPLNLELFKQVKGDWYVVESYESEPQLFADVQCFHAHYELTDKDNVFNVTRHQRYINQTRVEFEGRKVFEENNIASFYSDIKQDPDLKISIILLDYSVDAPSDKDNYLIFYACVPGQGQEKDYTIFASYSRQYSANHSEIVTEVSKQALARTGLAHEETKNFFNEGCGEEDPNWTTTPCE